MSINALRLQRFRGYVDATIGLRDLTVLLGPNSAGKSAFGHALAALSHAHRASAGTPQATLTPTTEDVDQWPIDLGGTGDLRTQGTSGPVVVGIATRGGWIQLGFGFSPASSPLVLSHISHPYSHSSAIGPLPTIRKVDTPFTAHSDVVPIEADRMKEAALEISRNAEDHWLERNAPVSPILDGLILKEVQNPTRTPGSLSDVAREDLRALLKNLNYLRATRQRPLRGYQRSSTRRDPRHLGYAGEFAPEILLKIGEERVSFYDPPSIPETPEAASTWDYSWKERNEELGKATSLWLSRMDLATSIAATSSGERSPIMVGLTLKDQVQRDITEIGF